MSFKDNFRTGFMGPEYGSKLSNKFVGVIYFSGLEIVVVVW
jgi:hypothetical protein